MTCKGVTFRLAKGSHLDSRAHMESPTQVSENIEQRHRRHAFYLRNGFRDTNVYRTYNDIIMTIMMRGEGTFTMKDWDDIIHELQQFWWPDDINEE